MRCNVAPQPLLRGERRLAGGRRAPHHPLDGRANRQEPLSDLRSLVIPRRTSDQRMAELLHQLAGRRQLVREPLDLRVLEEDRSSAGRAAPHAAPTARGLRPTAEEGVFAPAGVP